MKKSTKLVSAVVVLAVLGGTYVGRIPTYPKRKRQRAAVRRKAKQKCFP